MTKTRWRKDVTPDGVVTHTDPSGRVVIEKHTHHYGPWLIKDLDLDERVGETEVSEAEAKRLAEDYLASPRPVPVAPTGRRAPTVSAPESPAVSAATTAPPLPADPDSRRSSMSYAAAVHALATQLRGLADEIEHHAVPASSALSGDLTPHATSATAAVIAVTRALSGGGLAQLATLAVVADLALDRARRAPSP